MLQAALQRIQAEINDNLKNKFIQVVGGLLMDHIRDNPQDATQITAEGKTIAGSLTVMADEAKKNKTGNIAVLTTEEGFAVVLKYYGIKVPELVATQPAAVSFDVSLDDLLGE